LNNMKKMAIPVSKTTKSVFMKSTTTIIIIGLISVAIATASCEKCYSCKGDQITYNWDGSVSNVTTYTEESFCARKKDADMVAASYESQGLTCT
jgi:RNA polymerase subunit RPABC4/transcription elongation factor Spt4